MAGGSESPRRWLAAMLAFFSSAFIRRPAVAALASTAARALARGNLRVVQRPAPRSVHTRACHANMHRARASGIAGRRVRGGERANGRPQPVCPHGGSGALPSARRDVASEAVAAEGAPLAEGALCAEGAERCVSGAQHCARALGDASLRRTGVAGAAEHPIGLGSGATIYRYVYIYIYIYISGATTRPKSKISTRSLRSS